MIIHTAALSANNPFQFNAAFGGTGYTGMSSSIWNSSSVSASIAQPDDKIIVTGYVKQSSSSIQQIGLARFLKNGQLDTTFAGTGYTLLALDSSIQTTTKAIPQAIALDSSGRIVVTGYAQNNTANQLNLIVARFLSDGTPDATFGIQGSTGITGTMPTTAQAGGYVGIPAGTSSGLGYITLLFNNQLIGYGLDIQSDNSIVIVGQTNNNAAIALRLLSTGALDTVANGGSGFGSTTTGYITGSSIGSSAFGSYATNVLSSGSILIAGYSSVSNNQMMLSRVTSAGVLDTTFNTYNATTNPSGTNGYIITTVASLAQSQATNLYVEADGTIIIAGYTNGNSTKAALSARYSSAGIADTTYGSGLGYVITTITNDPIIITGILCDTSTNNIYLSGYVTISSSTYSILIRYLSDGSLDTSFTSTGYMLVNENNIPTNQAFGIFNLTDETLMFGAQITGFGLGAFNLIQGILSTPSLSEINSYGLSATYFKEFLYIDFYATIIADTVAQAATIDAVTAILSSYATTYSLSNINFISYLFLIKNDLATAQAALLLAYPSSSTEINQFFVYLAARIIELTA